MSTETLQKSDSKNAVAVTATWDGVRHWQNAAKMFEQGKLFSQVMIGFELLALRKANDIQHGGDRASSHSGNLNPDWETILEKEAGLAQSTAYRYMDMAKMAAPRLKKLPALKDFDPFNTPMVKLSEPQRDALSLAVKKLTDGKSQADFFEELYKTGGKGTGNADGKGSRKLTPEEQRAKAVALALENSGWMGKSVTASNADFFLTASENDVEIDAQISVLEFALKLRHKYRNTPRAKRGDSLIAEIEMLINKESPLKI